jgi:hypothetical protein
MKIGIRSLNFIATHKMDFQINIIYNLHIFRADK